MWILGNEDIENVFKHFVLDEFFGADLEADVLWFFWVHECLNIASN